MIQQLVCQFLVFSKRRRVHQQENIVYPQIGTKFLKPKLSWGQPLGLHGTTRFGTDTLQLRIVLQTFQYLCKTSERLGACNAMKLKIQRKLGANKIISTTLQYEIAKQIGCFCSSAKTIMLVFVYSEHLHPVIAWMNNVYLNNFIQDFLQNRKVLKMTA